MRITWKNLTLFAFLPGLLGSYAISKSPELYHLFETFLYWSAMVVFYVLMYAIILGFIAGIVLLFFAWARE